MVRAAGLWARFLALCAPMLVVGVMLNFASARASSATSSASEPIKAEEAKVETKSAVDADPQPADAGPDRFDSTNPNETAKRNRALAERVRKILAGVEGREGAAGGSGDAGGSGNANGADAASRGSSKPGDK